jgi:hypothetical protein
LKQAYPTTTGHQHYFGADGRFIPGAFPRIVTVFRTAQILFKKKMNLT